MFDHMFWGYKQVPNGMMVEGIEGYDDVWKLKNGYDVSDDFPDDAYFEMSEDFPDNTVPTDLVRNLDELIIVSERLKQFLQARSIPGLEFLRVSIRDHDGKPLASPYYIVHPHPAVECFDLEASRPTYSGLAKKKIIEMEAFVPDEAKCQSLPEIFRPAGIWQLLISRTLATALDSAGMTSSGYVHPDKLIGDEIPVSLRGLTRG